MTTSAHPRLRTPAARWALCLIGALLLTYLSTLTADSMPTAAAPAASQALTLGGITTLEQTFSTTQPGLIGLSLRVSPSAAGDNDLQIPIRLRYEDGPSVDLVSLSAPLSAAEEGLLTLSFASPIIPHSPHAITTTLRLIIDVPSLPPGGGPTVTVQANPEEQGRMRIDGSSATGYDLLIIPHYRQRLIDHLWPISAMAAGKPGLLGWPPLYSLLPYLYLILLIEGLIALRSTVRPTVDA